MRTVIVDVRTRKEFSEGSFPGAINIPSNEFEVRSFEWLRGKNICLLCQSGNRAELVKGKLEANGFENVTVLDRHMDQILENRASAGRWTIDRQFRLILALLIGVFFIGMALDLQGFWSIPIIIFSGLLFSAITDKCYLKILIASMPWNRKKESHSAKAHLHLLKVVEAA